MKAINLLLLIQIALSEETKIEFTAIPEELIGQLYIVAPSAAGS